MTDYIADDFASIAQRLRELEGKDRPQPTPKSSSLRWTCHNCNKYKREHEVKQRSGMKTVCLDCGAYVKLED